MSAFYNKAKLRLGNLLDTNTTVDFYHTFEFEWFSSCMCVHEVYFRLRTASQII